jgi:hypothetical protein
MSDSLVEERLTTADLVTPRQARAAAMDRNPDQVDQSDTQPIQLPAVSNSGNTTSVTDAGPLFPDDELHNFRARWDQVQTSFVDEPRQAVEQADSLVANAVKRIAEQFAAERSRLEDQWSKGDNVSTEDLRQAIRRYRSCFDRLLAF